MSGTRNFVYNPAQVVACSGCGRGVRGLQRRCRGCDKGVVCFGCWNKSDSTKRCVCTMLDEDVTVVPSPICVDCCDTSNDMATFSAVSEAVMTATVDAVKTVETVCVDYVIEPALGVVCVTAGLGLGIVGLAFDIVTYPVQLATREFQNNN